MTYNPAIPGPNDLISNSQGQIQNNFAQANTIFGVDHYAFNDTTNSGNDRGFHKQVTVPIVSPADPVLSAAVTGEFYTKLVGSLVTPFFAGWNGTATVVTPITGSAPVLTPTNPGQIVFPGGFTIKWAFVTVNGGPSLITFTTPFPTACFSVITQPHNTGAPTVANDYVYVSSVSQVGFNATGVQRTNLAANSVQFYYIAIGY